MFIHLRELVFDYSRLSQGVCRRRVGDAQNDSICGTEVFELCWLFELQDQDLGRRFGAATLWSDSLTV